MKNKIIFSIYQKSLDETANTFNTLEFLTRLDLPYIGASGTYTYDDGSMISEKSIILDSIYLPKVLPMLKEFNQESLLLIDENHKATLIYCESDEVKHLGYFTESSKEVALKQSAYTYIPKTDTYYIVVEDRRSSPRFKITPDGRLTSI